MTITSSAKGRRWLLATLPRFVVAAWIAWIAGMALIWGVTRMEAPNPYLLPLASLLAIELLGGLAVLVGGLWRMVRGPGRMRALGWLLLGTAPVWLSAGQLSYGIWRAHGHSTPPDPLVSLAMEGHAALADACTRFASPHRPNEDRQAMICDRAGDPQVMVRQNTAGEHPLRRVRVARGVEADWNAFLRQSAAAWAQTQAAYRQVQLEFEETLTECSAAGPKIIRHQNITIARDGDRHRMLFETGLGSTVVVASPQQSFHLVKKPGSACWTMVIPEYSDEPKFAYAGNRNWIRNQGRQARPLARLEAWICDPEFTVTAVEPFVENGERRLRVRFEYSLVREGMTLQRHGQLVFLPEARWALQSIEALGIGVDGRPWCEQLEVEYGAQHACVSAIRSLQWVSNHPRMQTKYASVTRIHRCKFGPTPMEQFTLAHFDVATLGWADRLRRARPPWHLIVTWSGSAVSLAIGMSLLAAAVCRQKSFSTSETPPQESGRPYRFSNSSGSAGWKREISMS